jgi:hypothetical protein
MRLWQYLLAADRKLNLSEPRTAAAWIAAQPWGLPAAAASTPWNLPAGPAAAALDGWEANVLALRSVAVRLRKARKVRPVSGMSPGEADLRVEFYVGYLRPFPDAERTGRTHVLTDKTYKGLRLFPTYRAPDRPGRPLMIAAAELEAGVPKSDVWWLDGALLFWQFIFWGLLEDAGPVICQGCGKRLAAYTKTGRKSRLAKCARCRDKAWRDGLSPAAKRAIWNRDAKKKKIRHYHTREEDDAQQA